MFASEEACRVWLLFQPIMRESVFFHKIWRYSLMVGLPQSCQPAEALLSQGTLYYTTFCGVRASFRGWETCRSRKTESKTLGIAKGTQKSKFIYFICKSRTYCIQRISINPLTLDFFRIILFRIKLRSADVVLSLFILYHLL